MKYSISIQRNKDQLDLFKANIQNLESTQLKGVLHLSKSEEIGRIYQRLVTKNAENISKIEKGIQQHKDYESELDKIKGALSAIEVDQPCENDENILRNDEKKERLKQIENEFRRLNHVKDDICNENESIGMEITNEDYEKVGKRIKEIALNLDERIEQAKLQSKAMENGDKLLQSLRSWVNEKDKLLHQDSWNLNEDVLENTLQNIHNLYDEIDSKFDTLEEIEKTPRLNSPEMNKLNLAKTQINEDLTKMKGAVEQKLSEGKTIQQLIARNKTQMELISDKQEAIKKKIKTSQSISNFDKLEDQIDFCENISQSITDLEKSLQETRSNLQQMSNLGSASDLLKILSKDLNSAEMNQQSLKAQIEERIASVEEKEITLNSFEGDLGVINDWIIEAQMMLNSIGPDDSLDERVQKQEVIQFF